MKRHSLLFGIQEYSQRGSLTRLTGAHADVDALADLISDPRYMIGDVGQVVAKKDATYVEALQTFDDFLSKVDRDDVVFIHFSGHGIKDDEDELYLCFRDSVEDRLYTTALSVKEPGNWMKKKGLRKVLVTLDCCYSGAAGAQMTRGSVSASLREAERPGPDGTGLHILTATNAKQTAKEASGRGVFTRCLVEGLKGAADTDQDGRITVSEIAEFLTREVPKHASQQTPNMSAHQTTGTFLVARNPKAIEEAAARAAAEQETAANAAREAMLSEALTKVRRHALADGTFSTKFASEVEDFVSLIHAKGADGPRYELLRQFVEARLKPAEFYHEWREVENADEIAARAMENIPELREKAGHKPYLWQLTTSPVKTSVALARNPNFRLHGAFFATSTALYFGISKFAASEDNDVQHFWLPGNIHGSTTAMTLYTFYIIVCIITYYVFRDYLNRPASQRGYLKLCCVNSLVNAVALLIIVIALALISGFVPQDLQQRLGLPAAMIFAVFLVQYYLRTNMRFWETSAVSAFHGLVISYALAVILMFLIFLCISVVFFSLTGELLFTPNPAPAQ